MIHKRLPLLFFGLCFLGFSYGQTVNIEDPVFLNFLIDQGIDTNSDGQIDVEEALEVTTMVIAVDFPNIIESLEGIKAFENLQNLTIQVPVDSVDLSGMPGLSNLTTLMSSNDLLDVSGCYSLQNAEITGIQGEYHHVDLSGCTSLFSVNIGLEISIESLDLSGCNSLDFYEDLSSSFKEINLSGCNSLRVIDFLGGISSLDLPYLPSLEQLTIGRDLPELNIIEELHLIGFPSLKSVSFLGENLKDVRIQDNGALENIEVSSFNGHRASIYLQDLPLLESVDLNGFEIPNGRFTIINCPFLTVLNEDLNLSKLIIEDASMLDVSYLISEIEEGTFVEIRNNFATSMIDAINSIDTLILDNIISLEELRLSNLPSLFSVEYCPNVRILDVNDPIGPILDASGFPNIEEIVLLGDIDLERLNLKNGVEGELFVVFDSDARISYICADEGEIETLVSDFINIGATPPLIDNSCSVFDGGTVHEMKGKILFDTNGDNCTSGAIPFPYIQIDIKENDDIYRSIFANANGEYRAYVHPNEYNYNIVPEGNWYNINPIVAVANFPNDGSEVNQDFCMSSAFNFSSVRGLVVPLDEAIPGFESSYKVQLRNVGSTSLDGNMMLIYPDEVTTFISAFPMESEVRGDTIALPYSNLLPQQEVSWTVHFRLNTPMDDPSLNGEDVLTFICFNESETNINKDFSRFTLNQIVFNSFDPNDKRCLDGETIHPDSVGNALTYMIRFENTGTANAKNIFIRDTLDTEVYDISTLKVLASSHDCNTSLYGNIVEFYFSDINLPFDDLTNDGYVTFSIDTKDDLELDDVIINRAGIYFDFNFPIITNYATSLVKFPTMTATEEIPSNIDVEIFPIPTNDHIFFNGNFNSIDVDLYSSAGILLARYIDLSSGQKLTVRNLSRGIYWVKITDEQGQRDIQRIVIN